MRKLFYKLSFLVLISSILFSCVKENTRITENESIIDIHSTVHFPDTIVANKYYEGGYVEYKHFKFNEYEQKYKKKALRSLQFCMTVDTIKYDQVLPDEKIKDTIWSYNGNSIKLFNIAVSKPGTYYLSGNIIDEILFDTISPNINKKLPGYRISSYVSKKIVVIDK